MESKFQKIMWLLTKPLPNLKKKNQKNKLKKKKKDVLQNWLVFDKKMLVKVNRGVISPRFRVSPIVGNINL